MWIRFLLIGFFSLTAISLVSFQVIEMFQAYSDMFLNKN
ncbi:hypothetical protein BACCIP111899_03010 [Bacillus rhizoplanae]|uniref:DUF4044 domain-containing protein n=1 Tax=Bacillus rhizoplanae TaxID=2880966 RepID=A0ABN8A4F4_9BACI|nr:hypothetical protein BACCIP111899_03010 [Bacillus rhizoplanae]